MQTVSALNLDACVDVVIISSSLNSRRLFLCVWLSWVIGLYSWLFRWTECQVQIWQYWWVKPNAGPSSDIPNPCQESQQRWYYSQTEEGRTRIIFQVWIYFTTQTAKMWLLFRWTFAVKPHSLASLPLKLSCLDWKLYINTNY